MVRRTVVGLALILSGAPALAVEPLAANADDYYKLTPTLAVSAVRNGDELFAELVRNLPPSNMVGGPQSVAIRIYGSCSLRQYVNQGLALFSGKWRAGYMMETVDSDNIKRHVIANSPMALLFDKECNQPKVSN